MKQFLKNNKTKIIILPAILLLGIFVGGCTDNSAHAKNRSEFTKHDMSALTEIGTLTDKKTGVQYIVVEGQNGSSAITPRLDQDGNVMRNN